MRQCFKYLVVHVSLNRVMDREMKLRLNEVGKVCGEIKRMFKC